MSEGGSALVHDPIAVDAVPLLDGFRTALEIASLLRARFAPADVFAALASLGAAGLIVEAAGIAPSVAALWSELGVPEAQLPALLAGVSIGMLSLTACTAPGRDRAARRFRPARHLRDRRVHAARRRRRRLPRSATAGARQLGARGGAPVAPDQADRPERLGRAGLQPPAAAHAGGVSPSDCCATARSSGTCASAGACRPARRRAVPSRASSPSTRTRCWRHRSPAGCRRLPAPHRRRARCSCSRRWRSRSRRTR